MLSAFEQRIKREEETLRNWNTNPFIQGEFLLTNFIATIRCVLCALRTMIATIIIIECKLIRRNNFSHCRQMVPHVNGCDEMHKLWNKN